MLELTFTGNKTFILSQFWTRIQCHIPFDTCRGGHSYYVRYVVSSLGDSGRPRFWLDGKFDSRLVETRKVTLAEFPSGTRLSLYLCSVILGMSRSTDPRGLGRSGEGSRRESERDGRAFTEQDQQVIGVGPRLPKCVSWRPVYCQERVSSGVPKSCGRHLPRSLDTRTHSTRVQVSRRTRPLRLTYIYFPSSAPSPRLSECH